MFKTLLTTISRELGKAGLPYMIIGGQAVLLYGTPRLTNDIDITLGVSVGLVLMPLIIWLFGEPNILIFYALGLAIFLGIRHLPTFRKALSSAEGRNNIVVDKRYKPWQARRDK